MKVLSAVLIATAIMTTAAQAQFARTGDCLNNPDIDKQIEACTTVIDVMQDVAQKGMPLPVSNRQLAVFYERRGSALMLKGETTRARPDLDKAIEIFPQLASVYLNDGMAEFNDEKFADAITHLTRAINLNRNVPLGTVYMVRGFARMQSGQLRDARFDLDKAIAIDDKLVEAFVGLGMLAERLDDPAGAIIDYRAALFVDPKNEASRNALIRLGVTP